MSDKNTSTLQSYVDSATSAVQSAIGAVTGNPADKKQAEDKKAEAQAKDDLSHAAAKAGPFTVSTSGVAKDDPNRTQGSWNQTVGSGKEMVGNLVGSESLKQEGARQNQEGKGQEAQGQLSDLGGGIADRVGGTIGGAVAGLTGNEDAKKQYEKQHDQGKTAQRGVEAELQKQADAQK
ncbi:hypothetical protein DBV05_g4098 [Lasiodiplodia theobromae]|uniref:CsbD-like domain-containing protein n=1 Tax=Lasiodiplodia theobromae TaxID=45133 RepID=A0A5N5DI05_9PEZI|nr:hypothetical protein DBV05_g4098 [Lasiodiplodia theobromae]